MTDVKEFTVTEDFLGLDLKTKNCQDEQTWYECKTKNFFLAITNNCHCVPFSMRNYTSTTNMKVSFLIKIYHTENEAIL